MRTLLSIFTFVLLATSLPAVTVYVKLVPGATPDFISQDVQPALPAAERDNLRGLDRVYQVDWPENGSGDKRLHVLKQDPRVEYAEYAVTRSVSDWPDDAGDLYALNQVHAAEAWDISHGSSQVVIAVVDVGTDWVHADLAANIFVNAQEASGTTGVDDDGNGFVDDLHGWDFFADDNDPDPDSDGYSHGTHVAGICSAVTNNGLGVASIAWNVSVMPVRAGENRTIYNGYQAIHYAAHNGAHIINLSWGGTSYSSFENDIIQDALDAGAIVVAAAGNSNNSQLQYPAAYDGVISVANVNEGDVKASSSCYGTWVDLAAPGVNIYSTLPSDQYGYKTGTSMAAPQVASLLGLLWSYRPDWNSRQVEQQVVFTTDPIDALNPDYAGMLGTGRINAATALGPMTTALRLSGVALDDASGDGIIDPGETVSGELTLTNYLSPVTSFSCQVTENDPWISISDNGFSGGALNTGESASGTIGFQVEAGAPSGHQFELQVAVTADAGAFQYTEYVYGVVQPIFTDHDNAGTRLTVTSFGAFGYYDNQANISVGSGFQYPPDGPNSLWHGSFLLGLSDSQVSDCASWNQSPPYDFTTLPGGELVNRTDGEVQTTQAIFSDLDTGNPIGVEVEQTVRTIDTPATANGVLLEFRMTNGLGTSVHDLIPALWMDFDAMGDWGDDYAGFNESNQFGYQYDDGGSWFGVGMSGAQPVAFRAVDNNEWVGNGFTDAEKYQFMTEGFVSTNPPNTGDWSLFLAAEPVDLAPGASSVVTFCLLAGDSESDLLGTLNAMQQWQSEEVHAEPAPSVTPTGWKLERVFPNPFNPNTTLFFQSGTERMLEVVVLNILGQQVLRDRIHLSAGATSCQLKLNAPSGVYLLRTAGGNEIVTEKLLLLR